MMNGEKFKLDYLINFRSINERKLKVFYVKRSHRKLKLKKLTIKVNSSLNNNNKNSNDNKPCIFVQQEEFNDIKKNLQVQLEKSRSSRPKKLLIFVNPYGGKGKGLQVFKKSVKPLLELAQIEFKLIVTQYANHAREIIQDETIKLEIYDGIIGVGGDGMFSELMNGLLFRYNHHYELRQQHQQQQHVQQTRSVSHNGSSSSLSSISPSTSSTIQTNCARSNCSSNITEIEQTFRTPEIPIGIISAGSTDANSFGLIGTNDVTTATLNIILGNSINIDVCSLHSYKSDKLLRFASTFAAYGYFGDVVRESEKLRWLGPSRYDLTGFNNLIKHRNYTGHLRIHVSDSDGSPFDQDRCHKGCKICTKNNHSSNGNLRVIELEGPFVGVNAAVTACRCPQTRKGFSPSQHLGNGCADLIVVRPCSRLQYLKYLLRTASTKKSPFELNFVDAYRCREFEFIATPGDDNKLSRGDASDEGYGQSDSGGASTSTSKTNSMDRDRSLSQHVPEVTRFQDEMLETKQSSWNVDGEVLSNENSIRVRVNNQLLRVFGTGEPDKY